MRTGRACVCVGLLVVASCTDRPPPVHRTAAPDADDLAIMAAVLDGPVVAAFLSSSATGAAGQRTVVVFDSTARTCAPSFELQGRACFDAVPGHHALSGRNQAAGRIPALASDGAVLTPLASALAIVAEGCAMFEVEHPGALGLAQFSLPAYLGAGRAEIYVALYCGGFPPVAWLVPLQHEGTGWRPGVPEPLRVRDRDHPDAVRKDARHTR